MFCKWPGRVTTGGGPGSVPATAWGHVTVPPHYTTHPLHCTLHYTPTTLHYTWSPPELQINLREDYAKFYNPLNHLSSNPCSLTFVKKQYPADQLIPFAGTNRQDLCLDMTVTVIKVKNNIVLKHFLGCFKAFGLWFSLLMEHAPDPPPTRY